MSRVTDPDPGLSASGPGENPAEPPAGPRAYPDRGPTGCPEGAGSPGATEPGDQGEPGHSAYEDDRTTPRDGT
ncbi:hypothetical protein U8607_11615 [Methylobacterium durans]|uniref:hypothetical protein n=1 Tax=Methylobacterium durans TaxID=2202825 RepID=UPI002AFDF176|nr:hypothetical protein [Methylobacterium durans]MEA1832730.1 hypothetical protein [Methylobacterium durans]